jgi:hypothetical protein
MIDDLCSMISLLSALRVCACRMPCCTYHTHMACMGTIVGAGFMSHPGAVACRDPLPYHALHIVPALHCQTRMRKRRRRVRRAHPPPPLSLWTWTPGSWTMTATPTRRCWPWAYRCASTPPPRPSLTQGGAGPSFHGSAWGRQETGVTCHAHTHTRIRTHVHTRTHTRAHTRTRTHTTVLLREVLPPRHSIAYRCCNARTPRSARQCWLAPCTHTSVLTVFVCLPCVWVRQLQPLLLQRRLPAHVVRGR